MCKLKQFVTSIKDKLKSFLLQNGELLRIMKGDTIGSTDLHLVCGDRLLVGAVHADMEINEYSGRKGVFNHTLQVC